MRIDKASRILAVVLSVAVVSASCGSETSAPVVSGAAAQSPNDIVRSAPGLPVDDLAALVTLSDAVVLGVGESLGTVDLNGSFGRSEAEVFSLSVESVLRGSVGSAGASVAVVDSVVSVPVGKPAVFILESWTPDDPVFPDLSSVAGNTELFVVISWNSILPVSGENIAVPKGSMRLHAGMPLERQFNLAEAIDAIVAAPLPNPTPVLMGPGVDPATNDWLLALNEMCASMRPVVAELIEILGDADLAARRLSPTELDRVAELSGKLASGVDSLGFGTSAISVDIASRWKQAKSLITSIRTRLDTLPTLDGSHLTGAIDALHFSMNRFQLIWTGLNVNECRQFV